MVDMMDWLCEHWDQPEEGIWETRGGRQDFTYGRFQCWVALDRAIRLADRRAGPANIAGGTPSATASTGRSWSGVGSQGTVLRPALRHRRAGLLAAADAADGVRVPVDPMWLSTLDAMDRELVSDSLVYRYDPSASPDGLRGQEGTFSLCTFWYVDALARSGRLDEAALTFQKMHTYANHLGLYSEEIGLTGEQLGNFPQAFSHLSLINAAINLDYQLDHGAGFVGLFQARSIGGLNTYIRCFDAALAVRIRCRTLRSEIPTPQTLTSRRC